MKHWLAIFSSAILAVPAAASTLSITDTWVVEGTGSATQATFYVTLDADPGITVEVDAVTAACSASEGLDYAPVTTRLVFDPGGGLTKTVTVPIVTDTEPEGLELLSVNLSNPTGATLGRSGAWGQILDDDTLGPNPRARCDANGDGRSDIAVLYNASEEGEPPNTIEVWPTVVPSSSPGGGSLPFAPEDWTPLITIDRGPELGCKWLWKGSEGALLLAPEGIFPGTSAPVELTIELPGLVGDEQVIGSGDFNGDEEADVVVWRPTTRQLEAWLIKDGSHTESASLTPGGQQPPAGWFPVAVVDLDRDGDGDVVWRTAIEGPLSVWQMRGVVRNAVLDFGPPTGPPSSWVVVASGDFDGNGDHDLLWRNNTSLRLVYWLFTDRVRTCGGFSIPDRLGDWPEWEVTGPR